MRHMRKMLSIVLCLCMLLSMTVPAAAAEDGYFYLTASKTSRTLIEPVRVSYQEGQTIREALASSEYAFDGLEQGHVTAIEEQTGNFYVFYEGGAYSLDESASVIQGKALCFSESNNYSEELLDFIVYLGQYREREDNVHNYKPAVNAYGSAIKGIRYADAATVTELRTALETAVAEYEALVGGEKFTITVSAVQNGTDLAEPEITLTDAYGNVTETAGTTLEAVAGTYTICVSDGGYNRTQGSITVAEDTAVSVELPYGEWFGDVKLLHNDGDKPAFEYIQNGNSGEYFIPDTMGRSDILLNAAMGADVPDTETTVLRAIFIGTDGVDKSEVSRSWESKTTSLSYLLAQGLEGRTFTIEGQYTGEDGFTQIQSFDMTVTRIPTLASLSVSENGTALPLVFDPETLEYAVTTVSDALEISADAFADEGTTITGCGTVNVTENIMTHQVTVAADNGQSRTYTLNITKEDAVDVTVRENADVTVSVVNGAGAAVQPVSGVYRLIPGDSYTCVATRDGIYHASVDFTASAGLTVDAPVPETENALSDLVLYDASNTATRKEYDANFAPGQHGLTITVPDANSTLYAQATALEGYTVTAMFSAQSVTNSTTQGSAREIVIDKVVDVSGSGKVLTYSIAKCGYSQNVTFHLSKTVDGVTYYQDYLLLIARQETFKTLEIADDEGALLLSDSEGNTCTYNRNQTTYYVTVPRNSTEVFLSASFQNETNTTVICGGFYAVVNGERYETLQGLSVALDPQQDEQTIEVTACHVDEHMVSTTYTFVVQKTDPVKVTFDATPADAAVFLVHNGTGRRAWEESGSFELVPGDSYSYTVTSNGYVGVQETEFVAPDVDTTVTITLEEAPESEELLQLEAQWPYFRADKENNGVVSSATPTAAEEAVLYWAVQLSEQLGEILGAEVDSSYCGCPIIVDNYLYAYVGSYIVKVDTTSGQIVDYGAMDHASSFAINSPTYADGMIFVGLSEGTVQAFNASTLESLWIYRDPLRGQPNCPITYHDGYIYTGFWLGESTEANYVCLSVTDEDPSNAMEEKLATWSHTQLGGFYWAGSYVTDDYLILGTDDGAAGYVTGHAQLLAMDPASGKILDSITLDETGDIRSSITFIPGETGGTAYFTTKGGYFYRVTVEADGTFAVNSLKELQLYNYASDAKNPAMSTCTPVVYNDRAYIGVSGTSQFGAYSGHNLTVIDLKNWDIAYTVRTQGYPQTSGLLTTDYEEETGSAYVYFFDNYTPGKLRMMKDKSGQTAPELTTVEGDYTTAYTLFTPYDAQAQYAICSPIADANGTIYFKNDSGYMMALGSTIEKLEITQPPEKITYQEGETFDGTGMTVTATYTNGLTRDVTEYVTWSDKALTADDANFEISFPHVMYQNKDGNPGTSYPAPATLLKLTVEGGTTFGDVNGDGKINSMDASLVLQYAAKILDSINETAADVNGDDKVNSMDASLILQFAAKIIDHFPVEG